MLPKQLREGYEKVYRRWNHSRSPSDERVRHGYLLAIFDLCGADGGRAVANIEWNVQEDARQDRAAHLAREATRIMEALVA